jgi:hypothetical protein
MTGLLPQFATMVAANMTTITLLLVIVTQLTVQVERRIGLGWTQANYRVTS